MKQRQICMALDLKDDPRLIEEYKNFHLPENIWPEIPESIRLAGVRDMQIFLVENHLFMILDVENDFGDFRSVSMNFNQFSVAPLPRLDRCPSDG